MPDLSAVNSWPAAVVAVVVLLSLQIPGLVSTVRTRRDARVIREQTENEHQDHPFPNMREQLDAIHADVRAAQSEIATVQSNLDRHVEQADAWQTAIEDDLTRRPWWRR